MSKIYADKPLAPDKALRRIDPQTGKVHIARMGPDKMIGQVNLEGMFPWGRMIIWVKSQICNLRPMVEPRFLHFWG